MKNYEKFLIPELKFFIQKYPNLYKNKFLKLFSHFHEDLDESGMKIIIRKIGHIQKYCKHSIFISFKKKFLFFFKREVLTCEYCGKELKK